jgi:LPS export ABC transporter protein LptC
MTPAGRIRLLRRLLVAVMVAICLAVVAIYVGYRHFRRDPRVWVQAVAPQSLMNMDRVHHTATRDGRTEWVLDAQSAQLDSGDDPVLHLTEPAVRFFLRDGAAVDLSARKGRLHTASSDIEVLDGVVVKNEAYRLETERMHYDHARRRLQANAPVRIQSGDNTIRANTMTVFIDQGRAKLSGNVKGVFHGSMLR